MTINASDIKLLESEIMSDTTDAGGRRTSRIIQDGVAGNIFPKVSRLDSVYGRVNLRKVFGAVQTANTDTYAGAHVVITDAPDNAKIHNVLFSTASEFDNRTAARDRIESYVTSGTESRMTMLGRQLPGQQSILAYQRVEEPLPEIGEVFCLSNEPSGVMNYQQYVRVSTVEHEVRTFTDGQGEFKRRVITLGTGVPLRYEFNGPENVDRLSSVTRTSKVRTTTVVDAARYYGIRPLVAVAAQNALTVKVDSVYTPIVPTTNRETPLANVSLGGAAAMEASKAGTRTETLTNGGWTNGATYRTLRGIKPGSVSIAGVGVTATADDKTGVISHATFSATVDYENGTITRTGGTASASTYTATYTPAVSASQIAHSMEIKIELANRGTVYSLTLNPLPAPGSAVVDYRALGKWYRLRDRADGSLIGDDQSYGVGTIDYTTGSVVLTLGALPDAETSIIVSYGSPAHYAIRSGATSDAALSVKQKFTLPDVPINPDSVSVTYVSGGVEYTATDNAAGILSGNGIAGTVNYATGEVSLSYSTRMPDSNTNVSVAYSRLIPTVNGEVPIKSLAGSATSSVTLPSAITVGSLNASIAFGGKQLLVKDNGSGLLIVPAGQLVGDISGNTNPLTAAVVATEQVVGTINYGTGALAINTGVTVTGNRYHAVAGSSGGTTSGGNWLVQQTTLSVGGGTANYGWKDSGVTTSTEAATASFSFATAPVKVRTRTSVGDQIVPGSLLLNLAGKTYIDRNGTLYADVSNVTGVGTTAGTVNYENGDLSLNFWANGASLSVDVECCLTVFGEFTAASLFLRTGGAPIRPGSFYIQATAENGTLISATANNGGVISGTKIVGEVNQETGVVSIMFGEMVTAAGNEGEYWFDAGSVVGGMIWKPTPVIPSTVRYNAVVLSNLPLNADILGLDPVRLPSDGRVPIYRPADVVVIHNTASTTLTNPVTPGATYSAGRTNLAEAWIVDQNGVKLTTGQYAVNLAAGTVTIAGDFTAGTLVQPLVVKHRIEDMMLVTDVQINGELTLSDALTREYGIGSYCSSAILFGDMNARVTNVHDLLSFGAWSDTPGTQATAQYNNIDYPLEVLNNGAVTERWRINFTSTTAFQVVGENLGVIATGNTSVDCSPTNQLTGLPYFVIRASGWGSGWSAGNQLRFNTVSASAPIWVARTILPGATLEGDSFSLQVRGDVDAE